MRRDHERELERENRQGRIFAVDVTKLGRWVAAFFSKRKSYKPRTFEAPASETAQASSPDPTIPTRRTPCSYNS